MTRLTQQNRNAYALLAVIALAFLALLAKNSGLYPFVFGDEYTYSRYSRLQPLSESLIPGYLYLAIYRLTSHCGTDFLGCARILNALFFVASAPFIYWVARRVASFVPSLLITLCAMAAPINVYTAHFMPEALYFFGFWVFVWCLTRALAERWTDWGIAGFILGCTALIKPHSMLFVPALLIYIGYLSACSERRPVATAIRNIAAFLIAGLVAKFALSLLIAGPAGLTFFGPSYNRIASTTTTGLDRIIELAQLALISLRGHVLSVCLLMALPVAVALQRGGSSLRTRECPDPAKRLSMLAVLLLANLMPVVALFSASVVNSSVFESITRLHMRYYDFMFPLLWIVVASQLAITASANAWKWRLALAVLVALPTLYGIATHMEPFKPNLIDGPEIFGLNVQPLTFYVLSISGLIALGAWAWSPRFGAALFIYGVMPLTVLTSSTWITKEQRIHKTPDVYDQAGTFAREYLNAEERKHVVVIGSDMGGMLKATFYMDSADITHIEVTEDNHYDFKGLPAHKNWVLSIGQYVPYANGRPQIIMPGFTLTNIEDGRNLDFRVPISPRIVNRVSGLWTPEVWGTWSVGASVSLDFARPLPEKFRLHLKASAFGPNIGKDFILHAGESRKAFTLTDQAADLVFDIDNSLRATSIKIDVPAPTSPAQMGMSSDDRKLGLGLVTLSIEPVEH
jgi:phosphoglycerol transferase